MRRRCGVHGGGILLLWHDERPMVLHGLLQVRVAELPYSRVM